MALAGKVLYCANRFYSVFIISRLKEKVRKSTGYFVSQCKVRGRVEKKKQSNWSNEISFLFFIRTKMLKKREKALPGEISPFSLDYPTSKALPPLPWCLSFINKATCCYYSSCSFLLSFIFCYLVNKERSSASGPTQPDLTWTINCCSGEVRRCEESSFSCY